MNQYHNILFVSNGIRDDAETLLQAISLANAYKAKLDILIICPPFHESLGDYQQSYEKFLLEKMQESIDTAKASLSLHKKKTKFKVELQWGSTPDIRIIQQVILGSYDLVIKAAENNDGTSGFKALDMSLLRKCPSALFIHRPFKPGKTIHIAVAVDPKYEEVSGHDLALSLLHLSHALSIYYKGHLSIISCWDLVLENYLRHSVFVDIPRAQLDELVMNESNSHYRALHTLIHEASIEEQPTIYLQKGMPTELIPSLIDEKKIDVLVMGTVARTGIAGFIIGNTAENILQKINCSLWALKPKGFISPVKPH